MKQTLLSIKRKTNVTTKAIAERAQLPIADVFVVETGGFCSTENAQLVLTVFNQLSGMQVRLEDIALHHSNSQPTEQSLSQPARKAVRPISPVKRVPANTRWYNQESRP